MKGQRRYDAERFKIGCYLDESAGSADEFNLRTVEFAMEYGFKPGRNWRNPERLSEVGDEAVSHLNGLETRSFISWGFEDNSLFLMADVDGAREEVGFVSCGADSDPDDSDFPAADFRGEWLHVSDHGNATLYARGPGGKDVEIWSVV